MRSIFYQIGMKITNIIQVIKSTRAISILSEAIMELKTKGGVKSGQVEILSRDGNEVTRRFVGSA